MRFTRFPDFRRTAHRRGHIRNSDGHVLHGFEPRFSLGPVTGIKTGIDRIKPNIDRLKIADFAIEFPRQSLDLYVWDRDVASSGADDFQQELMRFCKLTEHWENRFEIRKSRMSSDPSQRDRPIA